MVRGDIALGDRKEAGEAGLGGEEVVVARIQRAVADPKPDREELAGRVEQEAEVRLPEELLGLVGDRLEPSRRASPRPAVRRRPRRPADRTARRSSGRPVLGGRGWSSARSRAWLLTASRAASAQVTSSPSASSPRSAVRAAATSDSVRACADSSPRASRPGLGRRRDDGAGAGGQLEGLVEVPPGERLASAGRRRSRRRPRGSGRSASPIPASAAATGSGWSIIWRQALDSASRWPARLPLSTDDTYAGSSAVQVARVVPVVQVPAEPFEAADGRERRLQALHHLERPDPTEVASRHGRQQVHPDVRRRGAMGDDRRGIVLEVVGRQPVVLRADEGLEEPPGPAGGQAEGPDVGRRELLRGRFGGWQADPSGDERARAATGRRTARRSRPAPGFSGEDEDGGGGRDRRRRPPSAGRTPPGRGRGWPWPARRSSIRGGFAG